MAGGNAHGGGGRSTGGGSSRSGGAGRSSGGARPSGGAGRSSGGARPTGNGSVRGGAPAGARPAGGAPRAGAPRPAPAPRPRPAAPAPRPPMGRPRVRPLRYRVPCPFGLMFSQTMMYDDIYLVREALFRMVNGYARPDDPMLVSRFFGRRLSPFEFAECLQWLDGYLNEWGY